MPALVSLFGVKPQRIGGTETFARELSRQLAQRGWNSVLCFLSEPTDEVRSFLESANTSIRVVEGSTESTLDALRALKGILREHRADALHLHFTGFLGFYPWLAKLLSVRHIFFTDHSSRPAGYVPARAPIWKRVLVRLINQPITRVICVSKYGYRCMTTLDLLPRSRFELVYNGVDLTRVDSSQKRGATFRRRYSIPETSRVVLQVSWIIPDKGIPELLETAQRVVNQDKNVRFIIVGEGPYREQYMKDATEMGLQEHIIWTGLLEDPFGAGAFDAADIVCQLSHWEEVFGWMIAEAMAYAKPVVATRVGGIPELVEDQVSGFLVTRGDLDASAARILTLANDPDMRRRFGAAGQEHTQRSFSLQRNVTQLLDVYDI